MIFAWKRANKRERFYCSIQVLYENSRHIVIGFKLVVRFAMPFKSFTTLGTVLPNTENFTAMKPTESLTRCPYWRTFRSSVFLSPSVRNSFFAALYSGWCSAFNASSALLGPSSSIKSRALIVFPPACMLSSATSREGWAAASLSSALVAALLLLRLLPSPLLLFPLLQLLPLLLPITIMYIPSDVMLSIATIISYCLITNNCKLLQLLTRCSVSSSRLHSISGQVLFSARLGPAFQHQKTKTHKKSEARGSVTICVWSAQVLPLLSRS